MDDAEQKMTETTPQVQEQSSPKPSPGPPLPCSRAQCRNDHVWPVQLAIGVCAGCNSHVLARRLSNCPACNEPAETIWIRIDHLGDGGAIVPVCKGAMPMMGGTIEIKRTPVQDEVEMIEKGGVWQKSGEAGRFVPVTGMPNMLYDNREKIMVPNGVLMGKVLGIEQPPITRQETWEKIQNLDQENLTKAEIRLAEARTPVQLELALGSGEETSTAAGLYEGWIAGTATNTKLSSSENSMQELEPIKE